ncbi:hypothetical protein YOLOSWAG_253 [Erwinia phage vB_EamM_Yoloswag]|uniref:Uncharacterized protein n=1 Tax=Erwinia phage vB_EamM_Yoloswag TaxID=1958956 RepID=A0A1S6L3H3_9CAUD|nr:hypothetical protein HOR66_gp253 [Erwinia phage vB_EamM_Yoloswag]AQT28727.1 hypothetical protein YOLOSWAG_253 [Erwinia phage vB_EamM_Yoloswag]
MKTTSNEHVLTVRSTDLSKPHMIRMLQCDIERVDCIRFVLFQQDKQPELWLAVSADCTVETLGPSNYRNADLTIRVIEWQQLYEPLPKLLLDMEHDGERAYRTQRIADYALKTHLSHDRIEWHENTRPEILIERLSEFTTDLLLAEVLRRSSQACDKEDDEAYANCDDCGEPLKEDEVFGDQCDLCESCVSNRDEDDAERAQYDAHQERIKRGGYERDE